MHTELPTFQSFWERHIWVKARWRSSNPLGKVMKGTSARPPRFPQLVWGSLLPKCPVPLGRASHPDRTQGVARAIGAGLPILWPPPRTSSTGSKKRAATRHELEDPKRPGGMIMVDLVVGDSTVGVRGRRAGAAEFEICCITWSDLERAHGNPLLGLIDDLIEAVEKQS